MQKSILDVKKVKLERNKILSLINVIFWEIIMFLGRRVKLEW